MAEDELQHISSLDLNEDSSPPPESLDSNSFIMNFLTDFNEELLPDIKSSSSLQLSKSSLSQLDPPTMIISKATQHYDFAKENPMKTISDLSFESPNKEIPTEAWRMSEAITSAKDSFVEDMKEKNMRLSIHQSSFAIPNKVFCNHCQCEVFTTVSFHTAQPRLWDSFESFCSYFTCLSSKNIKDYHELVHICRKCNKVLVRISAE